MKFLLVASVSSDATVASKSLYVLSASQRHVKIGANVQWDVPSRVAFILSLFDSSIFS